MKYLLDTNTVIDMLKARRGVQRQVIEHGPENCFVSDVTIAELWAGYYWSGNEREKQDINFILTNFTVLHTTPAVWENFAENSVVLRKKGCPVPALDLLIMSTAMINSMTAVSHDIHFSYLPGLKFQDWTD